MYFSLLSLTKTNRGQIRVLKTYIKPIKASTAYEVIYFLKAFIFEDLLIFECLV